MTRARVVVVGDLMVDVVAHHDGPLARGSDTAARVGHHGGGGAANVAAGLARLEVEAVLCARVGDDLAAQAALAALRQAGVDVGGVVADPERPTGTCVVLVAPDGERTMLPDRGANDALAPGDLPGLAGVSAVHLSGYALLHPGSRAAGLAAIATARAHGVPVSVDPASAAPIAALGPGGMLELLRGADLLVPNADEARALTGAGDALEAARTLAATVGAEVVVTLGAGGAAWTDGGPPQLVPAPSGTRVVDTTGAGDAFTAGLLAARLRGDGPAAAIARAHVAASEVVARSGARPAYPPSSS